MYPAHGGHSPSRVRRRLGIACSRPWRRQERRGPLMPARPPCGARSVRWAEARASGRAGARGTLTCIGQQPPCKRREGRPRRLAAAGGGARRSTAERKQTHAGPSTSSRDGGASLRAACARTCAARGRAARPHKACAASPTNPSPACVARS
eukprot:scaffold1484_cov215-Prasinococcus_capsulatus_cf.AAC.2